MQWRSQTNDRILEEGDGIYLNALDNQVNLYSEMILLNYLPDNVPLDAKFTVESNSLRTSISSQAPSQAQTQTPIILWCQLRSTQRHTKNFAKGIYMQSTSSVLGW